MISRIRGTIREQTDTRLLVEVGGITYEILVPPSIMLSLNGKITPAGEVDLVTFHYQQLEMGKGFPVLIGFLNEIEREFFERFITVSGVGPKAALKALTLPIPVIAKAIDEGNLSLLRSLPGIGEQRAKEIVAKLQGKVGKFALIQTKGEAPAELPAEPSALEEEAIAILLQLEYKRSEAKAMLKAALARNPKVKDVEELLNEVYRQRRLSSAEPVATSRKPGGSKVVVEP